MTRINIFFWTICSLLIAAVFGYNNYAANNKCYFVVEMAVSANGPSQIFFDTGRGTLQKDSIKLQVDSRGFQKYSFPVPSTIKSIRFDPIDRTSVISIKKAVIENVNGDTLKNFPFQSFRPAQQISSMVVLENVLVIHTTENANDPIIEIEESSFNRKTNSWMNYFVQRGWVYVGYALISLLIFIGLVKSGQQIFENMDRLINYSIANPGKVIALVGLIAAVASCYPVVFFGKSFVHPASVGALYGAPPWMPGLSLDSFTENFRGSDVGATAWSFAPNSVVQHDSIFSYFEFPFWNRYVSGGLPLFAQGQSMIGDILHWIPVFIDGNIGWDIKFVLSKAIFAIGMGLLVFRLTGKLISGLLITISSCFLGFFAFRFNHPTFFVLTYAPWIILQWERLGLALALPNPRTRTCVSQAFLLAAVTWLQLNAGAPKEGVITACFMHAFGLLVFVEKLSPKRGRIWSFVVAAGVGFVLVAITAPYWLLFLDLLGKSYTAYDIPTVSTFQPYMIIGFFDNFFFQKYFNSLTAPSTNLFILFGVSSAFLALRQRQSSIVYGIWVLFILAMTTAYGLIPKSILIVIPLINKINHVGDTFSEPMMIIALIIAGYGICDYLRANEKFKKAMIVLSIACFFGLWLILDCQNHSSFSIENRYLIMFFLVLICLALLWEHGLSFIWKRKILISLLICLFFLLHVRHGMHLMTGIAVIDTNVMNPTNRVNFAAKSKSIEYIKNEINKENKPMRVVGEREVLFPGYSTRLGLEGLVSAEAIRSMYYEKLLAITYTPPTPFGWLRLIKNDQIASRSASLDLLGVGYVVATPGTKMPQDMKLVHSSDLDVWKRESVWPRAFFVNKIIEVHKTSDISDALADNSRVPFAAVESQYISQGIIDNNVSYKMVPAREYRLTSNSTNFSVEASSPGIIVLGETYYPGDFVASLNGEEVGYIRVNEASKGIWVNKAGKYDVSFTYRPERLNQALWVCIFGWVSLLLIIRISIELPKRHKS